MKFWILGGQGMLGQALQQFCKARQIQAVATSRSQVDVTDYSTLLAMAHQIRPTHMINCAAYTDVDGAERNQDLAFRINAQGARDLALVAKEVGSRFLHVSSDYVFNGKSQRPYFESDLCDPISVYGASKWEGEKQVLEVLPQACIVRTSWLFGSGGKNFVSSVCSWLQEKEQIQVVADQSGCPTYVHDLAQALITLCNAEGIFHFCNAGVTSRHQLAQHVSQLLLSLKKTVKCQRIEPVTSAQFPTTAKRPAYSALCTEKYSQITGEQPRPWTEAMRDYLDHASTS